MNLLIGEEVRKTSHCGNFCVTLLIYPRSPQKMFGITASVISIEEIQNQGSLIIHNFHGSCSNKSKSKLKKIKGREEKETRFGNTIDLGIDSVHELKRKKVKGYFCLSYKFS